MSARAPILRHRWQIDLAGLLVLSALGAGAYFLQIEPLLDRSRTHDRLQAELAGKRSSLAETEQAVATTARQLEELRASYTADAQPLEPAADLNRRLFGITELATEAGLEIDRIDAQAAAPQARFQPIDIRLNARASYRDAVRFLQLAHERLRHTGITTIELGAQPGPGEVRCQFSVRFVWYAAPAAPPAATASADNR
jgi:type II secretory pathway component PulM